MRTLRQASARGPASGTLRVRSRSTADPSLVTTYGRTRILVAVALALAATAPGSQVAAAQVKSFQKISDTQGDFGGTLDNADQIGGALALIGDLDGDGIEDIVVGAKLDDDGGSTTGAVWIMFLGTDGKVDGYQKISDTAGDFTGALDNFDQFGSGVAGIGDLDGDGIEDLAVGAHFDDDGTSGAGAVWILFLGTDGKVDGFQKISSTAGDFGGTLGGDAFGRSVAAIGDLDGDGIEDLAVGAPQSADGGSNRGAVWILFMGTDGKVDGYQEISDLDGDFTGELDDFDQFGISVAGLGDIDGDGIEDLAVGAQGDADGGASTGAVWILFLGTDGKVDGYQKISDIEGGFTGQLDTGDFFGASVAGLGDLNGDGIRDLAVGSLNDGDGGLGTGAFWILYLNADGTVRGHQKVSDTEGGFTGTIDTSDAFGSALANAGDVDGDGTIDVVVGAPNDDDGGSARGAAWLLFLQDDPWVGPFEVSVASPAGWHFLANPVSGTTFDSVLGGLWTQGFSGADASVGDVSVYSYNETDTNVSSDVGFEAISNQTDAMTVGKGYAVYVFEDNDLSTSAVDGGFPKTLSISGSEADETFSFSPSYTATKGPADADNDGWNLMGNPFGATIDWDTGFTKTNLNGTVYVWDPSTSAYKTWNGTTGDLTNGLIAPLQGFFVHANASSPVLSVSFDAKSTGATFLKSEALPPLMDLELTDGAGQTASAYLMFTGAGSAGPDPLDGYALTPLAASWLGLSTLTPGGVPMDINHLPVPPAVGEAIPVQILAYEGGVSQGGAYTLSWPRLAIPASWHVELHDAETGTVVDLRARSSYHFLHSARSQKSTSAPNAFEQARPTLSKGLGAARFSIVITTGVSTAAADPAPLPSRVLLSSPYPNPSRAGTTVRYQLARSSWTRLEVFDMQGRWVSTLVDGVRAPGWHEVGWDPDDLPAGVYWVRLVAQDQVRTTALTRLR